MLARTFNKFITSLTTKSDFNSPCCMFNLNPTPDFNFMSERPKR